MKQLKSLWFLLLLGIVVCGLVGGTALSPWGFSQAFPRLTSAPEPSFAANPQITIQRVNALFEQDWHQSGIEPAAPVDDLQVLRRLSLALFGMIPSLEDLRQFESDSGFDRLDRWTVQMLMDDRFNNYFAERMAVAFIGDRENDFPVFRRERFQAWLSDQIRAGRPYDEFVRSAIAATGQVTVSGATNFVMAEISQGDDHANRLAGRVSRAFLGQRIDCAECHNHPFASWKQADFQGLAAYFAQVRHSGSGVFDDVGREHQVENRQTLAKQVIAPRVPFQEQWLPGVGSRREQLAAWVTHPDNRRFRRAIANRVWGLMFGRPYLMPVDDIPDPPAAGKAADADLLDILGDDLAEHGFDLRRLARVVVGSRPFRLASTHPRADTPHGYHLLTEHWAAFPLIQLRTEQIGRSMQQLQTVSALHLDSNALSHTYRLHWMKEFSEQYGSLGELELDEQSSSVQQAIVRMTGRFTQQSIRPDMRHATTRIAAVAQDDAGCVDACFLVCLTRRPTPEETTHFVNQLRSAGRHERLRVVEDIFWSMLNCSEFAWNH